MGMDNYNLTVSIAGFTQLFLQEEHSDLWLLPSQALRCFEVREAIFPPVTCRASTGQGAWEGFMLSLEKQAIHPSLPTPPPCT